MRAAPAASEVLAALDWVDVVSSGLQVVALEDATITATTDAQARSSGGNVLGQGTSLARSGTVSTNNVTSSADALLRNSRVTTSVGPVTPGRIADHTSDEVSAVLEFGDLVQVSTGSGDAFYRYFGSESWQSLFQEEGVLSER